jgi:hypothetical protein
MAVNVYARTLHKAAELMGGRKKLARYLRVPISDLEKWIGGDKEPPIAVFLKAVDLVLDETAPNGGASEPGEPPPSKSSAAAGDSSAMW